MCPGKGRSGDRSIGTGDAAPRKQRSREEFDDPATAKVTALNGVDKFSFVPCPVCGKSELTVERKQNGQGWWIGCWACPGGGDYLRALAAEIGAPNGGALLHEPLRYLGTPNDTERTNPEPAPLPSEAMVAGWHSRLRSTRDPLRHLMRQRKLSTAVIAEHKLGWDGECFTLPVRDVRTGELINVKRRRWPHPWPGGARYRGLRNRPAKVLYPDIPTTGFILCAGEFDALCARRYGFPAVTVCSGSGTNWSAEWDLFVVDKRIAVIFDADPREEAQAESRAAQLREAGAEAWVVRLSHAGMSGAKGDKDITDWFKKGRSAGDLKQLINDARRPRRGARGRR